MNIQNMLDKGIMVLCAMILSILATVAALNGCTEAVEVTSKDVEVIAINRDIYLPEIEFMTLSDSENEILERCTGSSNRIVYEFALATFSGHDENLRTLGQIAFRQCLKIYSLTVADVE